ncbi:MAG: hypothetical protein O3B09_04620 [Proteobacteria bacterium]|nr:hypothetical protein [Pseudomonadota bacterium]
MTNQNYNIPQQAKELVDKYGKKAIEIAQRRVDNLSNQHSRESDQAFMFLNEVEKLVEKLD